MEIPHCYELQKLQRRVRYPYRLDRIGWMPHHLYIHDHTVIPGCFVCLSSNQETVAEVMVDGKLYVRPPGNSTFAVLAPGTRLHSLRAARHDELFFQYPETCAEALFEFFGPEVRKEPMFRLSGFPEEPIAEIRDELLNPEAPGAADRLDQLAIRLFTEILLKFRCGEEPGKAARLKLHAIATELRRGRKLAPLLKKYGYSERNFYREWGKLFRLTPNAYKLRHMVDSAGTLLTESDLPPAEIAARCGFGSAAYFYEQFRRHCGTTPQKFREAAKNRLFPRDPETKPENGD